MPGLCTVWNPQRTGLWAEEKPTWTSCICRKQSPPLQANQRVGVSLLHSCELLLPCPRRGLWKGQWVRTDRRKSQAAHLIQDAVFGPDYGRVEHIDPRLLFFGAHGQEDEIGCLREMEASSATKERLTYLAWPRPS